MGKFLNFFVENRSHIGEKAFFEMVNFIFRKLLCNFRRNCRLNWIRKFNLVCFLGGSWKVAWKIVLLERSCVLNFECARENRGTCFLVSSESCWRSVELGVLQFFVSNDLFWLWCSYIASPILAACQIVLCARLSIFAILLKRRFFVVVKFCIMW